MAHVADLLSKRSMSSNTARCWPRLFWLRYKSDTVAKLARAIRRSMDEVAGLSGAKVVMRTGLKTKEV